VALREERIQNLALGKNRLKVEFFGEHEYRAAGGPMANTGELSGTATIEGTVATLKELETVEGCTITMTFKAGKMVVRQDGECGFGAGVFAGGTYRRVSSRKPSFTEEGSVEEGAQRREISGINLVSLTQPRQGRNPARSRYTAKFAIQRSNS
jgi:hypothetical protein